MIRVLVVDDDRMARKGLMHVFPWREFGMEVVGEASNGRSALEALDRSEVDLVMTDLEMPLMTGIELMQAASRSHRTVKFVVLSFHQDFNLVQESLRLGALDYIAKSDLEREQMDQVLGRIRDRFVQAIAPVPGSSSVRIPFNDGLVYLRTGPGSFPGMGEALDPDTWVVPGVDLGAFAGWKPVAVTGLLHETWSDLRSVVEAYRQSDWFYDQDEPGTPAVTFALPRTARAGTGGGAEEIRDRLFSYDWIVDEVSTKTLWDDLRNVRLAPAQLLALLTVVQELWIRIHGHLGPDDLPEIAGLRSWAEVEGWLAGFRRGVWSTMARPKFSPHVQASILNALRILHTDYAQLLVADDLAKQVNMSRSYFCDCFHQITGQTFLACLTSIRMERARELLSTTEAPVYEVAQRVGYLDEKYFSRQFRETCGVLPKEYRRSLRQG